MAKITIDFDNDNVDVQSLIRAFKWFLKSETMNGQFENVTDDGFKSNIEFRWE